MATYNPLLIQRQKLAQEQAAARAVALARIRELMATFAITSAELEPPRKRGPKPGARRVKPGAANAVKRKVGRPRKNSGR
jgi:DNA-binding protein H-NS